VALRIVLRALSGLGVLALIFLASVGLSSAVGQPTPSIVTAFTELFISAIILPAWIIQPRRQAPAPPPPLRMLNPPPVDPPESAEAEGEEEQPLAA
jgi:hypothetical protein